VPPVRCHGTEVDGHLKGVVNFHHVPDDVRDTRSGEWTRRIRSTQRIGDGYEDFLCVDRTVTGFTPVGDEILASVLDFLCDLGKSAAAAASPVVSDKNL
jgi:hypothetical protein